MDKLAFSPDRLIGTCSSWDEFWAAATALTEQEKGDLFERLTQLYLLTKPKYNTELSDVWFAKRSKSEIPSDIRRQLNLPDNDEGIDLVARTRDGQFWAIQAKFKSDPERPPTYKELSTFNSLAFVHCNDISLGLVVHTSKKPVRKRRLLGPVTEVGLGD
jgi:predicted helicase